MAPAPPFGHKNRNYRRHPLAGDSGSCSTDDSDTPGIGRDSKSGCGHGKFAAAAVEGGGVNSSRRADAAASSTLQLVSFTNLGGSEHGAFFDTFDAAAAAVNDGGPGEERREGKDEVVEEFASHRLKEENNQLVWRKSLSPSTASSYCSENGAAAGRNISTARNRGTRHETNKRIASGFGYNMLKSMGWRDDTGLGKSSNGIVDPILPKEKPNHLGLGFNVAAAHDVEQEKIKQIQQAKREERDRKLQLKAEEAERAEEEAMFMRESSIAVQNLEFESEVRAERLFSDGQIQRPSVPAQGHNKKAAEAGQCPHCGRLFDTKLALKSHVNARHAKLQHEAAKKQLRKERRQHGDDGSASRNWARKRKSSSRSLAPMAQDLSVYD